MTSPDLARARLEAAVATAGLVARGVIRVVPEDGLGEIAPGRPIVSVLLVGWRGRAGWAAFAGAEERRDGMADPLDRWSRRVIGEIAAAHGGRALHPFAGPPWLPFQRWGMRAEGLTVSPLGLAIDTQVGLWHGWRGAIAVDEDLGDEAPAQVSPCDACRLRSCLVACPADAFTSVGYDVGRCRGFLDGHAGGLCRTDGCRARDACPIGRAHRYAPEQIRFLMAAFRASLTETDPT